MTFTINGINWKIKLEYPNSKMLMRSDNTVTLGVTDNNRKTVYISKSLSNSMFDKVLCHELVHVFSFSYNLLIPIETEEIIADFLATYGRDVFDVADDIMSRFIRVA